MTREAMEVDDVYAEVQARLLQALYLDKDAIYPLGAYVVPSVQAYQAPSCLDSASLSTSDGAYRAAWFYSPQDAIQCAVEQTVNSARCSFRFLSLHDLNRIRQGGKENRKENSDVSSSVTLQYDLPSTLQAAVQEGYRSLLAESSPFLSPLQRNKPVGEYDISFLVLPEHVKHYGREGVVDRIVRVVRQLANDKTEVEKEMNTFIEQSASDCFFQFYASCSAEK